MRRRKYNYKQYGILPDNICSCFVIVLKLCIYSAVTHSKWGVVMVWRVATLPMSHYIVQKNYHQERATELC